MTQALDAPLRDETLQKAAVRILDDMPENDSSRDPYNWVFDNYDELKSIIKLATRAPAVSEDSVREAFWNWAEQNVFRWQYMSEREGKGYADPDMNRLWLCWSAAIAAMQKGHL